MGSARKWRIRLHAWALVVGVLFTATSARAYTLKERDGNFVRWHQSSVTLHVASYSADLDRDTLDHALEIATDSWRGIGGTPDIVMSSEEAPERRANDGINGVYVLDPWPRTLYGETHAVTISTYDWRGRLLDTDVMINGTRHWAVVDEQRPIGRQWDLASVLAHEMGHVLGLDESDVPSATMWPRLGRGQSFQRSLDADDEDGVVALYGAESASTTSTACSAHNGGCSGLFLLILLGRRRTQM